LQDVASKSTHKRTFSEANDPDKKVTAKSPSVLPSNKKAKSNAPAAPDSENELERSSSDLGGGDLPLTCHGPNVFYGTADALSSLFETGDSDGDGFWLKSQVMDAYHSLDEDGDIDSSDENEDDDLWDKYEDIRNMSCGSIFCEPEDLEPPEAKALRNHFKPDNRGWCEVTLMRHLPAKASRGLQVELESGYYGPRTGAVGEKNLGKWWITEISVAEGGSEEAVSTVISKMY
jgi:hypothetical protein